MTESGTGVRAAGAGRAAGLDLLKAALVAAMVSAHVIQLVTEEAPGWAWAWSDLVNLVAFPGFLLAFGMGVGRSPDRRRSLRARAVPVVKMLLAVWASSFGFALLVEREPLDLRLVREVMTTEVLWGWSEFLTSFLVLYLLLAVARGAVVALAARPRALLAATALGLGSTLVTTGLWWPLIGGVVGHRGYPNFPLLAYGPWFLAGVHLARRGRGIETADLALGAALTGVFALWAATHGGAWPERFPPSAAWVVGPALPLLGLAWAAERIGPRAPPPLLAAGRHVLVALVGSNLALFAVRRLWGWPVAGGWGILLVSLALLAGVTLWGASLDRLALRRKAVP